MMIVSVPSEHVLNEFYLRQVEILPSTTLSSYDRTILLYFEGMTIEKNVLSQHAETIKVYDRNNKRIGEGLFKSATKSEQPGFSSSIHLQVTRKFTSYKKIQLAVYKTGMNLACRLQNGNESRNENFYA